MRAGRTIPINKAQRRSSGYVKYHRFSKHRRVRDTGNRASVKRTLSIGVEAAREGTPQSVSLDTPFQTGERELSDKMNFFAEQDENVMNTKGTFPGCEKRGSKCSCRWNSRRAGMS